MGRDTRAFVVVAMWIVTACDSSRPARASDAELPADAQRVSDFAREHPSFDRYWYRGVAEISRYDLKQSRYGELHEGEAVWIFVTEPFDTQAQVKYEGKGPKGEHVRSVLKHNAYRRFYTGVYPYTVMTSSFLPAKGDEGLPLKLTFSAQEWCGQVFTQLNRRDESYRLRAFSYFEAEGDVDRTLPTTWSEDALWSLLRRDPSALPEGKLQMIPALRHLRLRHRPMQAQSVEAKLSTARDGERHYTLRYQEGRRVDVRFEAKFPYGILGFKEDPGGGLPSTEAVRTRALMLPYWEKNGADDGAYRKALGLSE